MTDEPPLRSLERWLLAVDFKLRAEEAAARGSQTDHTIAVILADTAAESILALLVGIDVPEKYPALLTKAIDSVRAGGVEFPKYLSRGLTETHKRRNAAVHDGIEATESESAIDPARRLLALLPRVSAMFPDVPPGAGLLGAVAALVAQAEHVADRLRAADEFARGENWAEAAEAGSQALYLARVQSTPYLDKTPLYEPHLGTGGPLGERELEQLVKGIYGKIRQLESSVVPMTLGLRPVDYSAMIDTLGESHMMADGHVETYSGSHSSPADVRRALDLLAEVIVRLWTTGAMFRGNRSAYDEEVRRRWLHKRSAD